MHWNHLLDAHLRYICGKMSAKLLLQMAQTARLTGIMAPLEGRKVWVVVLCFFIAVQWFLLSMYHRGTGLQYSVRMANEATQKNDLQIPSGPLIPTYLYSDLPGFGECGNRANDLGCGECTKVVPLMTHLEKYHSTENPLLFVVPLDFVASLQSNFTVYYKRLDEIILAVTRSKHFVRFGGSDHIFMCLSSGCSNVMQDLIERAHHGGMLRALWFGTEKESVSSRSVWPCPNRVIDAPENLADALGLMSHFSKDCNVPSVNEATFWLNSVLERAAWNVDGKGRWRCTRKKFDVDLEYMKGVSWAGCMAVPTHKVCISYIPKCASTTSVKLVRKMIGMKNWNEGDQEFLHVFTKNGVKMVGPKHSPDFYLDVMTNPEWKKIGVLRDPEDRFISAYTNKILQKRELWRIGFKEKRIPSLDEVVDIVNNQMENMWPVDVHFMPESHFASMRDIQYDFIAKVENLAEDLKTIFTSLDLPDTILGEGWGKLKDMSFAQAKGMNVVNVTDQLDRSSHFKRMIRRMYKDDYALFDL